MFCTMSFNAMLLLRRVVFFVSVMLAFFGPVLHVAAQDVGPRGISVMATKSVIKYLNLERGLLSAIAAQDGNAVHQILDPEFECRTASDREPLPSDDWINNEIKNAQSVRLIRDLTVFETDSVTIVSFILDTHLSGNKTGKTGTGRNFFIVDVWQNSSDKLLVRYMDMPAHQVHYPDRPDGRE